MDIDAFQAESDLVFPGIRSGKPLSDSTSLKVLRDVDAGVTVHGLRSSFRDWVAEATNTPGKVAEAALAHTVPSAVERADKRTDFFEKRRKLMDAWAAYCLASPSDKVVPLRRRPAGRLSCLVGWRLRKSGRIGNPPLDLGLTPPGTMYADP